MTIAVMFDCAAGYFGGFSGSESFLGLLTSSFLGGSFLDLRLGPIWHAKLTPKLNSLFWGV